MTGVLFVCTGNMCRSPLAEAKFKSMMNEYGLTGWQVGSAGTWIPNGKKVDPRTINWAKQAGWDLSQHHTLQVSGELFSDYKVIVVMERGHKEALVNNFPQLDGKVVGLSELSGTFYDIPDPVSLPDEEFDEIAKEVTSLVDKGFNKIVSRMMKK